MISSNELFLMDIKTHNFGETMKYFIQKKAFVAAILYVAFLLQPSIALGEIQANGHKIDTSPSIYTRLANQALPVHTELKNISEMSDVSLGEAKEKPRYCLEVQDLSEFEKRSILYTIFHNFGDKKNKADTRVFVDNYWADLEFFCGPDSNRFASVFNQVNKTSTTAGDIVLQRILSQPTTNVAELKERQSIVKELISNEKLLKNLDLELLLFKNSESLLLSFWKQENPFNEEIFKEVYFNVAGLKNLNQNSAALELGTRWSNFINLGLMPFAIPTILTLMGSVVTREIKLLEKYPHAHWSFDINNKNELKHAEELCKNKKPGERVYSSKYDRYYSKDRGDSSNFLGHESPTSDQFLPMWPLPKAQIEFLKNLPDYFRKFKDFLVLTKVHPTVKIFTVGGVLGLLGLSTFLTYRGIKSAQFKNQISAYLHKRLICVSTAIRSMQKAANLVNSNKALKGKISHKHIDSLTAKSVKLEELINLLSTNTFVGEPSFFSLTGRILAAYKLMTEVKNELTAAIEEFGQIDAYCSVAKLYNSNKNNPVTKYCFAEYIDNATRPQIDAKNFWFPGLLNNKNLKMVVPNSVKIGFTDTNCPKNIILTGPNKGGKSCILKGIIVSLVLAQTIGIAPAEALTLTPFTKIQTYINIVDNSAEGISLFAAELKRAKSLIDTVSELKPGEFSFSLFDEVFNGTNPEEAIQGSAYIAAVLAKTDALRKNSNSANNITLIATHFGLLTKLETIMENVYTNYRVNVTKMPDGSLDYPFTWEKGISKHKVALDLMKLQKLNDPYGMSIANKFSELIETQGVA